MKLFVGRATRAEVELVHPVSGEARVRMAIDEPRDRAETAGVELRDVLAELRHIGHRPDLDDPPLLAENVRVSGDAHLPESWPAQGSFASPRRDGLRQVTN